MDFGKYHDPILATGSHSYWGVGLVVGLCATFLSWIPAYFLAVFCRTDAYEKPRGDDDEYEDENLGCTAAGGVYYEANNYGTAPVYGGDYGAAGGGNYGVVTYGTPQMGAAQPQVAFAQPGPQPGYGA